MGMIYDLCTITKCGIDTIEANAVVNSFIESKKLEMGPKKCHKIHISKSRNKLNCPQIKVHDNVMDESKSEMYIGDFITESGKLDDTLKDIKRKAYAIVGDILAILDEVPFGAHICIE